MFVILTDGLENSSKNYTRKDIFEMIEDKEHLGWTVVFLGADQDKYVAEQLGVPSGNIFGWECGNVGIGTSSPMYQLSVQTSAFLDSGGVKTDVFFNTDSLKVKKAIKPKK